MKKLTLILSLFLAAGASLSAQNVNTHEVTVASPGSLYQQLISLDADIIEGLIIHGKLNSSDLLLLNEGTGVVGSLNYLNLSDVTFDYDGEVYAQKVLAPEAGMGTIQTNSYILSESNYDEKQPTSRPDRKFVNCYRNNLAAAFAKNAKLKHVVWPSSMTTIGEYAFEGCKTLTTIEHNGITEVGDWAFCTAESMNSFDFRGIEKIGAWAFGGAGFNGSVDLSSVKYFGDGAFGSVKFTEITFGTVAHIGPSVFEYSQISSLNLPNPPDSIPVNAFTTHTLKNVNIGEGLKYIGDNAFGENVENMTLPSSLEEIGDNVISDKVLAKIPAEDGIKYIGNIAVKCMFDRNTYTVKEGTVSLGSNLFSNSTVENVILPSSLKVIGEAAFRNSRLKQTPDMPNVRKICSGAFNSCPNLTKAILPESLEYLGRDVFWGSDAIFRIEFNAINLYCEDYVTDRPVDIIKLGAKVRRIPKGLFTNNQKITEVDLPESVEILDPYAFEYCTNLKNINVAGAIKSIGENTFSNCTSLESINRLDVETIPEYAFDRCSNLRSCLTTDRTKIIGNNALRDCSSLVEFHWSQGLEFIGNYAFYKCNSLTVVSLPEGVVHVGQNAFGGCMVKTLYIPSTINLNESDRYCFAFANDNCNMTVTCMLNEPPAIEGFYWTTANRVGKVKVPAASLQAYKTHSEWSLLGDIITEVETLSTLDEESHTSFASGIDPDTDLSDTIVGDVYITLGEEDSYDAADGCMVLNSVIDEEYAKNIGELAPGESDIANRFNGLVLKVAAGKGTIKINCQTIGEKLLTVKIGNSDPETYSQNTLGYVVVNYSVDEPTCIYIYGSVAQQNHATQSKRRVNSRNDSEGNIRIYAMDIIPENGGITIVSENSIGESSITDFYTLEGRKVNSPAIPGIYIVRRADGSVSKVYKNSVY